MDEPNADLYTSVTEIDNCLIVALAGEMTDDNIKNILDLVTEKAYRSKVSGVILNFSMVKVMDYYTYRAFRQISGALSLLGVSVVWVGLSPGVVCALIDLNMDLDDKNISMALTLEQGLKMLSASKSKKRPEA
jgi:rsbT antagonist protein RsbS